MRQRAFSVQALTGRCHWQDTLAFALHRFAPSMFLEGMWIGETSDLSGIGFVVPHHAQRQLV